MTTEEIILAIIVICIIGALFTFLAQNNSGQKQSAPNVQPTKQTTQKRSTNFKKIGIGNQTLVIFELTLFRG
jgi:uncharacterized protein YxeA